jgi:DNA-binding IclR family transcriptional regulator
VESSQQQHHSATRGLATVAMLKVNFDAGRDHIAMFQPFVLDAVAHHDADLDAADIRQKVLARHELALPLNTLHTILGRIAKGGYLRREGGRYFRTSKPLKVSDVQKERIRVEERQKLLARRLRQAADDRGVEVGSDEDALAMILQCLQRYHIALAFWRA